MKYFMFPLPTVAQVVIIMSTTLNDMKEKNNALFPTLGHLQTFFSTLETEKNS